MNINSKSIYLFLILLICTLLSGCAGNASYGDKHTEEVQFICTKTIEKAPDNMSLCVSGIAGDYEYAQVVSGLPDDVHIIKEVDKPLTSEKLYQILQEYILNTGIKELFLDTRECKISDYKYEYIMKSTDDATYYIPVIAFTIENYGELYIDIEYGCFIF